MKVLQTKYNISLNSSLVSGGGVHDETCALPPHIFNQGPYVLHKYCLYILAYACIRNSIKLF